MLTRIFLVFLSVLALLGLAVLVAHLLGFTMPGFGTSPPSVGPELSVSESRTGQDIVGPELSYPDPLYLEPPVPEEPEAEMHTVVVEGLRCRLDGSALSECEDVCKIIEKSSGRATVDADAGSHGVVEGLRRCLEEAGVEWRWGS